MKAQIISRFFIVLVLSIVSISAMAQEVTLSTTQFVGFDVESGTPTGQSLSVEGKTYDIFATSKGSEYVKTVGKTGNVIPCWIGTLSSMTVDGEQIRVSKSGKAVVPYLRSNGHIWVRYMTITQ